MKILYLLLTLFLPLSVVGQTIKGIVKDEKNEPIPGVMVSISGTNIRTATNDHGLFQISSSSAITKLKFSASSYEDADSEVTGGKMITITLTAKLTKLDEIQVIAYGTNTQRYNIGSVTKVTADDISKQDISNPLEALQGRVPGLVVSATSGLPGASFNVQIRGQNTLKPSSAITNPIDNPLFIVDGVPFATQNGNVNQFTSIVSPGDGALFNNPHGGFSPFNSINPADIESIEVLRDADATAIYGSRGGNGVILITTKRGKAGKTDVNVNIRDGITFIGGTMPMLNTQQYVSIRKEAFANDGLTPNITLYDPGYAPDLKVFDTTRYTDWKRVFLGNTAHSINAATSVSGGTENTQFRVGAGFNRDTYIFPGDFADSRANFSFSLHHSSLDKKFTLDFSTIYSYDKNNSTGSPNLLTAYTLDPDYPALEDSKGNLIWNYKGISLDGTYSQQNPFAYLKTLYNIQNINLNSSLLLSYQLIKGLTIRTSLGYNTFGSQEYSALPASAQNPAENPVATTEFGNNNYSTWIIEPQLEYLQTDRKSRYDFLIGGTFQNIENARTITDGSGYSNEALIGSISGAATTTATDAFSVYKYAAVFGRFSYRYNNKYLFNLNARRDGSSRFGPSRQFGNFGSAGAGWLFGEELFMKKTAPALSYGKLRATYGITGSDAIKDYQFISNYTPTRYPYEGSLGYLPSNLYNPDLSWASTKKLEFGLELGFLNDRLLINSTWFRNRSGNQLMTYQLPSQTGFQTVLENWDATVQNTGFEFTIQSTIVKGSQISWSSSLNLTIPKNKLLSFPDIQSSSYATTYFIGQSVNTIAGFSYAGVNPTTGDFQFRKAAGQITASPVLPSAGKLNDYHIIGNTDPKFYGGWQNSISYKNLQLDVFTEFRNQKGLNYLAQVYSDLPGFEQNIPVALLNRWQSPGQQTNTQKFSSQFSDAYTAANNFLRSDGVFGDASYIRLKTITLSFTVPQSMITKANIRSLKVYLTAQNLVTITDYQGNDPETQNFYGVPPLKSLSLGLNLNL
ncbi:MAG: TonB-dependent Receptor Plug Domain protein [Mucilaginibacter sp.]|nr:TonB-dependent Receptor Plug Domain protein [Mucilaginibacter sp.]